jgi:hypothetical protein
MMDGTPAPAAPAAPAAPGAVTNADMVKHQAFGAENAYGGSVSAQQLRAAVDHEVSAGRLTREEGDAMLLADGVHAAQPDSDGGVDAYLAELGFPAGRAEQFELPPLAGPGENFGPDAQEFAQRARTWLAESKLTTQLGNHLATEIGRLADVLGSMDAPSRATWEQAQREAFARHFKADAPRMRALAGRFLAELNTRCPGVEGYLSDVGALNSAAIVGQIALHAERLSGRPDKTAR